MLIHQSLLWIWFCFGFGSVVDLVAASGTGDQQGDFAPGFIGGGRSRTNVEFNGEQVVRLEAGSGKDRLARGVAGSWSEGRAVETDE
jgi:hypothetical protein